MVVSEHDLIRAKESEMPVLRKIEGVLNKSKQQDASSNTSFLPKLMGPDGEEIELPLSVLQILQQIIDLMIDDQAISIVSLNKVLTPQEAADILNVPKPFLVSLLDAKVIPFTKVGNHQRIRLTDLMEYKKRRDEEREQALAEIAHISEDEGLYD